MIGRERRQEDGHGDRRRSAAKNLSPALFARSPRCPRASRPAWVWNLSRRISPPRWRAWGLTERVSSKGLLFRSDLAALDRLCHVVVMPELVAGRAEHRGGGHGWRRTGWSALRHAAVR